MILVRGDDALNAFRQAISSTQLLDMAQGVDDKILLINWSIGVGKSTALDQIIETATRSKQFGLVVVLASLRQVVEERAWVKSPPRGINVINLRPRPDFLCGSSNNKRWKPLESRGMGLLGKIEICGNCQNRYRCYWPTQMGTGLKDCKVIFGTQAHLAIDPGFIGYLVNRTKTTSVLVLLDEIDFTLATFRRAIRPQELHNFNSVLNAVDDDKHDQRRQWLYICELLQQAASEDLQSPDWSVPRMNRNLLLQIQRAGHRRFGDKFRCLTADIQQLCRSPLRSREKDDYGNIIYANSPQVPNSCIVFSGSANAKFTKYRLGRNVVVPFKDYLFEHPDTQWINIASGIGTKKNFWKNSPQILDFFAQLIIQRVKSGKRCLLIAKKKFLKFCAKEIERRLRFEGLSSVVLLPGQISPEKLENPDVIPIINYGIAGTNLFQEFDCAYCLMGYYARRDVIDSVLQDLLPSDHNIPLHLYFEGKPLRRRIEVQFPEHRFYDVNHLSKAALEQMEMEIVLQAIGRVRPFTRPREIITLQCGSPSRWTYTYEFTNLADTRNHFHIDLWQKRKKMKNTAMIKDARKEGLSQTKTALKVGLCLRTIKRHWNI